MNDYKEVSLSEHTTIGTIQTIEAGQEIHLKAGMQCVIDGGLSLTLEAGGQHIVLNPAGIWMTMPVWTGGVPMEGTPAVPLVPLTKSKAVEAVTAPLVSLKPYTQNTNNLKFHFKDNHQQPYANTPYIAYLPDGTTQQGTTDQEGYTAVFYSDNPQGINIHLLIGNEDDSIDNALASQGNNNLQFQLKDDDEIPYAKTPYIAYFQDGTSLEGTTDENGYTKVFNTIGEQDIDIHLDIGNTSKEDNV